MSGFPKSVRVTRWNDATLYSAVPRRTRVERGYFTMYGTAGRGLGLATGAGGVGASLAMTGYPMAGMIVLGLLAVVLGLALVRAASVRRPGRDMPSEDGHLDSVGRRD